MLRHHVISDVSSRLGLEITEVALHQLGRIRGGLSLLLAELIGMIVQYVLFEVLLMLKMFVVTVETYSDDVVSNKSFCLP